MELTPEEARVLGCLVEKERTVPDAYPLSRNALLAACNQSTNRWPVVAYDERTVDNSLASLKDKGMVRFVHAAHGSRVTRYRHVTGEALALGPGAVAVLAVLMLRGPQTRGELRSRAERLHPLPTLVEVDTVLTELAEHDPPLAASLGRRPGEKEERWAHLLSGTPDAAAFAPAVATASVAPRADESLLQRLDELEARVARLESELGVTSSPDEEVAPTV